MPLNTRKSLFSLFFLWASHTVALKTVGIFDALIAASSKVNSALLGWNKLYEYNSRAILPRAIAILEAIEHYQRQVKLPGGESEEEVLSLVRTLKEHDVRSISCIATTIQQLFRDSVWYKSLLEKNLPQWDGASTCPEAVSVVTRIDEKLNFIEKLSQIVSTHISHLVLYELTETLTQEYSFFKNSSCGEDYVALADLCVRDYGCCAQELTLLAFINNHIGADIRELKENLSVHGVHLSWESYERAHKLLNELQLIQSKIMISDAYQAQLQLKKTHDFQQQKELPKNSKQIQITCRQLNSDKATRELVLQERKKRSQRTIFNNLLIEMDKRQMQMPALTSKIQNAFAYYKSDNQRIDTLLNELRAEIRSGSFPKPSTPQA